MPYLNWITENNLNFLPLNTVELSGAPRCGVYVIVAVGSDDARTVKVGFGDVVNLVGADCYDNQILFFGQNGCLQVTWAAASPEQFPGIALYLQKTMRPYIKMVDLIATQIPVNVPGSSVVPDQIC